MRVICVHGWACTPVIWKPMLARLTELTEDIAFDFRRVNFGFFGEERLDDLGHFDLAIGHSLGLQWLLTNRLVRFDRLVSINGFTRFAAAKDFQSGWPHRIIQRMQRQLGRDASVVLDDFMQKAWGLVDESDRESCTTRLILGDSPDIERLNWGLDALLNGDGREQWGAFDGPKRAIAASKDSVVSVEHTNACFAGCDLQWLKSDCHFLPLKFPEICAALIRELIEVS